MLGFANIGEADPKPIDSATDKGSSAGRSVDWRKPIVGYLHDLSQRTDRTVRWLAIKYLLINNDLYHRTTDGLLLKCLDEDQARVAMGEVHDGLCGTH